MEKKTKKVVIIDCQLGNLFSVKQACDTVGINSKISHSKEDLVGADALILPGVGAFKEAMNNLKSSELIQIIKDKVNQGTPIFGICLGQQLLFSESEEFGTGKGLDLISGVIKKFSSSEKGKKIKVPNIGWNRIKASKKWENTGLADLKDEEFMYFIHSYFVKPSDPSVVLSQTNYEDIEFCSAVLKDNVFATQFHPEKSGEKGLSIYKNWALINNLI